jgi:hypothetical protein
MFDWELLSLQTQANIGSSGTDNAEGGTFFGGNVDRNALTTSDDRGGHTTAGGGGSVTVNGHRGTAGGGTQLSRN